MDYAASAIMTGFGRKSIQPQGNLGSFDGPIPVEAVRDLLFGWTADSQPLSFARDGRPTLVESHVANVRSDTGQLLGVVGANRATHQYADALVDNLSNILGGPTNLGINAAGYLRNGAVGYVSVSLPETVKMLDTGVEYLPNIVAYSSHDGSLATEYRQSVVNIACGNQMGQLTSRTNVGADKRVRIRHTRNSALVLESARHALGILVETSDAFETEVRELCETTFRKPEWDALLDELCPIPADGSSVRAINGATAKRDELTGLINSDPRCSPWRGTAWGAVQTFNTWSQHIQPVRGAHRDDRNLMATINGDWDAHDNRTVHAVRRVLTRAGA